MILNSQSEEGFDIDLQSIIHRYDTNCKAFQICKKDLGLKNSDLEMMTFDEFALKERKFGQKNLGIDKSQMYQTLNNEDDFMRQKYFMYQKHVLKYYLRIFQQVVQR